MATRHTVAVLDACVLFPFTLRDTLLRAAADGLYELRWSSTILDEMERNLVATATVRAEGASRLRAAMERCFPEAVVTDFDEGPMSSNPSANWTKLLVAPESNIASWMTQTSWMASSMT